MTKIIKNSDAKKKHIPDIIPEQGGVVHKKVLDARGQADQIVQASETAAQNIREEAEKILANVKAEREEALKKGLAQGESKGLALVTEKLLALDALREKFYNNAEPEVIKLVVEIAEKVIGKIATENTALIGTVVRQALEKTIGDRITVRLNPEDYKNLMETDHEFKDVIDRTKRLLFREDEAISKGGCVVETEVGTIDAQIEVQLGAIKKPLEI